MELVLSASNHVGSRGTTKVHRLVQSFTELVLLAPCQAFQCGFWELNSRPYDYMSSPLPRPLKNSFCQNLFKVLENLPQGIFPKETMKYLTFIRALSITMRNYKSPKFEVAIVNWLNKLQYFNAHSESLSFKI